MFECDVRVKEARVLRFGRGDFCFDEGNGSDYYIRLKTVRMINTKGFLDCKAVSLLTRKGPDDA